MEEYKKSRRKKRRWQKFFLSLLILLFLAGCGGLLTFRFFPELWDSDEITEDIRDAVMQVPDEVQELRDREIPVGTSETYEYYYQFLNENEKRFYRELLEGIEAQKTEIYVSGSVTEEISRAFRAVGLDHSELFWMHNHEKAFQTVYPMSDYGVFSIEYMYSEEEMAEIREAMEAVWTEVNQILPENAGDYEKVQTVYSYLIDEIEYVESIHDQSLAGAFWKKECVCAGYTRAAQYLLNRMDVPCVFVSGETIGEDVSHSWNVVEIDGANYYMDATNGDQTRFLEGDATELDEHKTIMFDYLCPIPAEYQSMFLADVEFPEPECVEQSKNFYVMNQGIFDVYDAEGLYEYCCMRLDNGAAVVRFKFSNEEEFRKVCEEWSDGEGVQEVAQYYLKLYNLKSVEYHIGVLDQFHTMYIMF